MNVKMLRSKVACNLLKGEQSFIADPATNTSIAMMTCGHFVVSRFGKHILFTGAQVEFAELDEPTKQK